MGLRIAVVGATGNVGREMLTILDERLVPADEVIALASRLGARAGSAAGSPPSHKLGRCGKRRAVNRFPLPRGRRCGPISRDLYGAPK